MRHSTNKQSVVILKFCSSVIYAYFVTTSTRIFCLILNNQTIEYFVSHANQMVYNIENGLESPISSFLVCFDHHFSFSNQTIMNDNDVHMDSHSPFDVISMS